MNFNYKFDMKKIILLLLMAFVFILCKPVENEASDNAINIDMEDGEYSIELSMTGGSGKASVSSPCMLIVIEHKAYA